MDLPGVCPKPLSHLSAEGRNVTSPVGAGGNLLLGRELACLTGTRIYDDLHARQLSGLFCFCVNSSQAIHFETDFANSRSTTRFMESIGWLATLAATLIPLSLIWDYSWETSIGVDRMWSPPHVATHLAVWLFAIIALTSLVCCTRAGQGGIKLGPLRAPAGAWLLLWGVVAFETAFLFDNWWQLAYGLGAGIWHPPQILKAAAFIVLEIGVLALCRGARGFETNRLAQLRFAWNAGMLLALICLMLGTALLANEQHAAPFYRKCAAVIPVGLLLAATAVRVPWGATIAALAYMLVSGAMVWLLPCIPAQPLTPPIHNPLDHLLPPPFPLLLVLPALVLDWLRAWLRLNESRVGEISLAVFAGLAFVAAFVPVQWFFAEFLLSPAADNWFFAGGGRHWPYFLRIDEARVKFWRTTQAPFTLATLFWSAGLAIVSSYVGIQLSRWLRRLHA